MVQTLDSQTSDGTNLRLTNVGLVQTSDWYKCRTVHTSDLYKRQTSTNVGLRKTFLFEFSSVVYTVLPMGTGIG